MALLSGLLVCVGLGAMTPWGRQHVAQGICAWVSHEIAGTMTIDEALSFDLFRLEVRGLRFLDPEGEPTVEVGRAAVTARWSRFLAGTVYLEAAEAEDVDVYVGPYGESTGTAIEATFQGPPGADEADGGGTDVVVDSIEVRDARVRILFGPRPTFRVSRGRVRIEHRGENVDSNERPTQVHLAGVHAVAHFPDRGMIDETPVRVAGSIFDLAARVCHERDVVAMRIRFGTNGGLEIVYDNESLITRIALGFTRLISGISLHPGPVDLSDVPEC